MVVQGNEAEEAVVVEMDELVIVATDEGPVRRYLRRLGVPELNIARYVAEARRGGPVTVSFGSSDKAVMPPLRLYCPGGSDFELTSPMS